MSMVSIEEGFGQMRIPEGTVEGWRLRLGANDKMHIFGWLAYKNNRVSILVLEHRLRTSLDKELYYFSCCAYFSVKNEKWH